MQLRITDGTTTVELSGGTTGIKGATYFPTPGEGGDSVAETIELIGKGTAAQIRAAANLVERLLETARRRQTLGVGTKVYLEYKPVTADDLWRSEMFDGHFTWSDDPGARQLGWTSPQTRMALLVERAPWWEGPEVEIPLSAQGQAAATAGRTVTNDGVNNWVQIAGAQVTGTLPAPVRLRLANATASAIFYREFILGLNAFSAPATFGHVLQGEERDAGFGTVLSSAACSGGQYLRLVLTTSGGYAVQWLLPAAMMSGGGRWFRLVMRTAVGAPSAGVVVRPSMWESSGTSRLWTGQETLLGSGVQLHDLGAVPMPPGGFDATYGRVMLKLWCEMRTGSANLDIDYIVVVPMDGYRHLLQVGGMVNPGDAVELDEVEGRVYTVESSLKYPLLAKWGEGLFLYPGVTQRLVLCELSGTGSAPIDHTFTARLWYRPRRSTV
jgi:hypothetical protein